MRYLIILMMLCCCCFGQVDYSNSSSLFAAPIGQNTEQFSVCFWAIMQNANTSSYSYTVNKTTHPNLNWQVKVTTNRFYVEIIGAGGGSYYGYAETTNNLQILRHYGMVYEGGNTATSILLYVDGVFSGYANTKYSIGIDAVQDTSDLQIGGRTRSDGPKYWDGIIADFRIYNRALHASEIKQIHSIPWSLADDTALLLRTCITTNATRSELAGTARNYGTGADGTYSNSPTVAPRKIRIRKPMGMEIP